MVHINVNIPIITMNVIGLNTPSKGRFVRMDHKIKHTLTNFK